MTVPSYPFLLFFPHFPEDHMYMVLNRFLLFHQSLDFRRVPEFFKLFYGFDLEVNYYMKLQKTLFLFFVLQVNHHW